MKKSKKKQASNKAFMEYVAKHNCCLMSHSSDIVSSSCGGGVQAHHLLKPWDGFRGMGMRASDNNCGVSQMLWHNFNYGEPDGDC